MSAAPTNSYLNNKNDQQTLVLLKPDAVHRNLIGDIICEFEEKGFKLAALKFMQGTEEMLKEHYADLAKKPFFPELVRWVNFHVIVLIFKAAPQSAAFLRSTLFCCHLGHLLKNDFLWVLSSFLEFIWVA